MEKNRTLKRLKQLGKQGLLALIAESTYAAEPKKCPSESVAKEMLAEVLLDTDSTGKAVVVTTFSSHIARLKAIIEVARKMKRKVLFVGRSLAKYVGAAEDIKIVNFQKEVETVKYAARAKSRLNKVMKEGKEKYLIVCTGGQGEPKATLSKMIGFNFFGSGDHVIFSCAIIPTPTNRENRRVLELALQNKGVRIFRDVHVSGHAAREDLRDLLEMVKPKYVIPAHGEPQMTEAFAGLAKEMGYHDVLLLNDGEKKDLHPEQ